MADTAIESAAGKHNLTMALARGELSRCKGRRLYTSDNVYEVSFQLVCAEPLPGINGATGVIRNLLTNMAAGLCHQGVEVRARQINVEEGAQ